jgi:hypothetical protein
MKKKLLSLLLILLVTFLYGQSFILAWDDFTFGPTVNTISGPTTGETGQSYTFSANVTSDDANPISQLLLNQTTDPDSSDGRVMITYEDAVVGSTTCSPTECNISGSFTPSSPGTYYLYISVNFTSSVLGNITSCNTHPATVEASCLDSRGEYITFVVSGEEVPTEDYSFGPTVTNISGLTTGVVGEPYSFSADVTSVAEYPIEDVFLLQTTNAETSYQQITITEYSVGEVPECTSLHCPISGEFTPSSPGTYYIHITVNFGDETDGTSCNTHPSILEANCLNSRGEYITFVVGEEALPNTASISTKTYIFISTGVLLILASFSVKQITVRKKSWKKFENRLD